MDVFITRDARRKLWFYVEAVTTEIGGMGYARMLPDHGGDVLIYDLFLCPQYASSAEVDFEVEEGPTGDEFAIDKAFADGFMDVESRVWLSWHSHGNIGTSWSSTDETRLEKLQLTGVPYVVSIVANRRRDLLCRFDAFNVEHHGYTFPQVTQRDLKVYLDPADPDPVEEELSAEVKRMLLKRPTPPPTKWTGGKAQPANVSVQVFRNGEWHVGGRRYAGSLKDGPDLSKPLDPPSKSLDPSPVRSGGGSENGFTIEPTEGEHLPVLTGPVDLDDEDAEWAMLDQEDREMAEHFGHLGFGIEYDTYTD